MMTLTRESRSSRQRKETLLALLEEKNRRRGPWNPLPGPQTLAYHSDADELFYGGAAGGGKSDLLLGLAATSHRKTIIFRREYPQLREIIERAKEILGPLGTFNASANLWRLTDGRLVEFGSIQFDDDKDKYQGRAHDLKAFDELPQFLESQYRFVIGWNRTTRRGQRCRVVGAGNPPTNADGEWVIKRWAAWLDAQHPHPAKPGELRWYAMVDGQEVEQPDATPFEHKGKTIKPKSRTFIPARLADNPYLLATDYESVVQGMPEPLRSQMLYGDFTAGHDDNPWQIIPTAWVRAAQARWQPGGNIGQHRDSIGVDVARGGKDKTVLARRFGTWFAPLEKHPGASTPDGPGVARLVAAALIDGGTANVDVIGVGSSVYDHLCELGVSVSPINFAEATTDRDRAGVLRFANVRAYAYWSLREALDPVKGDNLALPPDSELLADLCAPRWSMRLSGVLVESKEDIIKRIGRSPDCGDAVALAALNRGGSIWFA